MSAILRPASAVPLTTLLLSAALVGQSYSEQSYNWAAEKAYCAAVRDNSDGMADTKKISRNISYEWRCAAGSLYTCIVGADGVACSKRSRSTIPLPSMTETCKIYDYLPVSSGAYSYTWNWICKDKKPAIEGVRFPIDKYGYVPSEWNEVK